MTKNASFLSAVMAFACAVCQAQEESVGTRWLEGIARTVEGRTGLQTPVEVFRSENHTSLKRVVQGPLGIPTPQAVLACPVTSSLSIPSSVRGALSTSSCIDPVISSYEDVYSFAGAAGQSVTIDLSSTRFSVFLYLTGPSGQFTAFSTITSFLSSGVSSERIVYTLAQSGTYKVEAESLYAYNSGQPVTGAYTLSISAGSSGTCGFAGTLTCGSAVSGALTTVDCNTGGTTNVYVDFYHFGATAGSGFTVTVSSTVAPLLVTVQDASTGTVLASNTGTGSVTLAYTPTYSGDHVIGVAFLSAFVTGNYGIVVSCSGGAACTASGANLCLAAARFRVTVFWRSATGSGFGTAVTLTPDTGYFWFFNSANVEIVVKVLNACSVNSRYWVFAGGLTNVEVTLTVNDMQNATTRTYVNPMNVAFQPIQDTSAFPSCP